MELILIQAIIYALVLIGALLKIISKLQQNGLNYFNAAHLGILIVYVMAVLGVSTQVVNALNLTLTANSITIGVLISALVAGWGAGDLAYQTALQVSPSSSSITQTAPTTPVPTNSPSNPTPSPSPTPTLSPSPEPTPTPEPEPAPTPTPIPLPSPAPVDTVTMCLGVATGSNSGTITASGNGIGSVSGPVVTFNSDSLITLTATPNPGYEFAYWLVTWDSNQLTDNPLTYTPTANQSATAFFKLVS